MLQRDGLYLSMECGERELSFANPSLARGGARGAEEVKRRNTADGPSNQLPRSAAKAAVMQPRGAAAVPGCPGGRWVPGWRFQVLI